MIKGLDRNGWRCVLAAQHAVTAGGGEQISPDYLLSALLDDSTGVVGQALCGCGASPSQVRAAIGPAGRWESTPSAGTTIRPSSETESVLNGALAEAGAREHLYVEPGHLLLAMVSDTQSSTSRCLLELGVNIDHLRERLLDLLPTHTVDEEHLRQSSERCPRLTAERVRELTDQIAAWHEANSLLGLVWRQKHGTLRAGEQPVTISPAEHARLERVCADTKEAWLRLQDHHAYLAWAAAEQCAARGHDLAYSYSRATNALTRACLSYSARETTSSFVQYAKSTIAEELRCEASS